MTAADVTNEETLYTAIYFRLRKILRVVLAGIFLAAGGRKSASFWLRMLWF